MPKFSIITPQYNSFELMNRYFDSMERQTFKDFELIIIDDCSTDGSFEKLQEIVSHGSLNIKLFKTPHNTGPGAARNIGIENATGEWITFVDNDDWLKDEFLEKVNEIAERDVVNCIICDYYTSKEGDCSWSSSMYGCDEGMKSVEECIVHVRNHTFCKVYKMSECKEVRFPEVRRCEDVAYVCQAIVACGGAYYYKEPLYYYLQRPTSLSNNKKLDEGEMIKAFTVLEDRIGDTYPTQLKEKAVSDLLYGVLLMMCKSNKSSKEISNYIEQFKQKYPQWWKCEIVNKMGNSKKLFLMLAKLKFILGLRTLANIHSRLIK